MQIALRALKILKIASQETLCFEAVVLIDGKEAGRVSNAGHGGCHNYYPLSLEQQLTEHAKTQPPRCFGEGPNATSWPCTADDLIDGVLEQMLLEKQKKDIVRREVKTCVVFSDAGRILTVKLRQKGRTFSLDVAAASIRKSYPNAEILNGRPIDELVRLYDGAGLFA